MFLSQTGAALFHYKLGETLLQTGAAQVLLETGGRYYKLGQLLLQNELAMENFGAKYEVYYKLGQYYKIGQL